MSCHCKVLFGNGLILQVNISSRRHVHVKHSLHVPAMDWTWTVTKFLKPKNETSRDSKYALKHGYLVLFVKDDANSWSETLPRAVANKTEYDRAIQLT